MQEFNDKRFWSSLCRPGACLSLLTPRRSDKNKNPIFIRWQWCHSVNFFDERLIPHLLDFGIVESCYNCLKIVFGEVHPHIGLKVFNEDFMYLSKNKILLKGPSLGLPFIIGALSLKLKRPWPGRTTSWGIIKLDRNNKYLLQPTGDSKQKVIFSKTIGAKHVICVHNEKRVGNINKDILPCSMSKSTSIIEKILIQTNL